MFLLNQNILLFKATSSILTRTHKIHFKLESFFLNDSVNQHVPTQHFDSIVHHFPRENSPSKIFGCDNYLDSTTLIRDNMVVVLCECLKKHGDWSSAVFGGNSSAFIRDQW